MTAVISAVLIPGEDSLGAGSPAAVSAEAEAAPGDMEQRHDRYKIHRFYVLKKEKIYDKIVS